MRSKERQVSYYNKGAEDLEQLKEDETVTMTPPQVNAQEAVNIKNQVRNQSKATACKTYCYK